MRPVKIIKTALWIAFLAGISAAGVKYVAVVETEVDAQSGVAAKLNKAEVREITAVLRNEARNILPSTKYKIMTAETVIAQGGAKLEECAEENCVIALGSKIGADYIVRGAISKFQTEITLSVVMYETEDGTLVASARVSSEMAKELLEKTVAACGAMYRTFLSEYGIAPQSTYQSPPASAPTQAYQQSNMGGSPVGSTFTDNRDGKTYKTAVIGGKRWMAENINYKTDDSWCYDNNDFNCGKYGRLYNWSAAATVCPAGWHLPSRSEWKHLVDAVGDKGQGKKLKSKSPRWNGKDAYGFSALPGGVREANGRFYNIGHYGYWWTSTENGSGNAYYRNMFNNVMDVLEGLNDKGNGFSVRCVQE